MFKSCLIELTRLCIRGTCCFCSSKAIRYNTDLNNWLNKFPFSIPDDRLKELTKEIIDLGVKTVEISGGEPLLKLNALKYMVKDFLDHDITVKIFTSFGDGSEKERTMFYMNLLSDFMDFLDRNKLHKYIYEHKIQFHTGFYGITNNSWEILTGHSDNKSIVMGITSLLGVTGFYIGYHYLLTKVNVGEVYDSFVFANTHFVKEFSILRLVPQGRAKNVFNILDLGVDDFLRFWLEIGNIIKYISENESKTFITIKDTDLLSEKYLDFKEFLRKWIDLIYIMLFENNRKICQAGVSHFAISYDGTVLPCVAFKDLKDKYSFGNIKDGKLIDILNSDKRVEFIKLKGELFRKSCSKCKKFGKLCSGLCIAQRLYNKSIEDPYCIKLKEVEKILGFG